jgi:hypothetical protein
VLARYQLALFLVGLKLWADRSVERGGYDLTQSGVRVHCRPTFSRAIVRRYSDTLTPDA